MSRMQFLPELTEFLRERGRIYTVRSYEVPISIVNVRDVGQCKRRFVKVVYHQDDLEPFVESSGFDDVSAWWIRIKQFVPYFRTGYLYEVTVL